MPKTPSSPTGRAGQDLHNKTELTEVLINHQLKKVKKLPFQAFFPWSLLPSKR